MNTHIFLALVVCLSGVVFARRYDNKHDGFDIDKHLSNDKLVVKSIKCFMDEGPCTAPGQHFKDVLSDVLKTDCEHCNDAQKSRVKKLFDHLKATHAEDWDRINKKYGA